MMAREGGVMQRYRTEISVLYGKWIADICMSKGVGLIDARPWDTAVARAIKCLDAMR